MPRYRDSQDSADDDVHDWEDPDESDMDEDDGDDPALVPCPHCRAEISEDADVCPRCGSFITAEDPRRRLPWLILIGMVLAALIAIVLLVRG